MQPLDEGIRRSIHEARIASLRDTMLAASHAADRWQAFRTRVGRRLIAVGERLVRPAEALAARASL